MKLFEYMASGSAIIATDVGEQVSEVIKDRKNGLLVKPGDASDLASALVELIQDPDLRRQLGSRAREDAILKYSWENYLSRLEAFYVSAVSTSNQQVP